jgi:autotransporter-associated beta strand protein
LYKSGSGTFTLNGTGTYTNPTAVAAGTLLVNGNLQSSAIQVAGGAVLGGTGTVGTIAASGIISPGDSPGILTSSNVTFSSSGSFTVELTGPNPGVGGYDQLNVSGTVSLANASLAVFPEFTTPVALGQQFTIINNDLADAISGTFNSLPGGSTISIGGYKFTISYVGGTGNDVVLTLTGVPGAAIASAVTSGDGNHAIDPNDCNSLYLVVTNKTGSAMTGVSATLSAATPGVIITQPNTIYPDIPPNGTGTNLVSFGISTLPDFVCGTPITLQLSVISSVGAFAVNYVLNTGEALASPSRYDVTGNVSIPDIGTVDSTNVVSGFTGTPLQKVVVSLYITHPYDSDLTNISLISPDGTTVLLSSANGGSGQNYGSGLTPDSDRTTFDDAAATPITSGTAPFVGTYQPQSPLSAFIDNATPNGNWRLHIADGYGGSLGTLRGWSLFLYGTGCSGGSGQCELCPNISFTSAFGPANPVQTNFVTFAGGPSVCGVAKVCPGTSPIPPYPAESYTFRNGPTNTCITVTLENISVGGGMVAAAYLGSFDPHNPDECLNYLGDLGSAPLPSSSLAFSFNVASNATFVVNVIGASYGSYSLTVTGCDCTPVLDITALPGNQTRLDWTSAAGGYRLAATPALNNPSWTDITNEPIVGDGRFNVTNSMNPTNRFYRLHKP